MDNIIQMPDDLKAVKWIRDNIKVMRENVPLYLEFSEDHKEQWLNSDKPEEEKNIYLILAIEAQELSDLCDYILQKFEGITDNYYRMSIWVDTHNANQQEYFLKKSTVDAMDKIKHLGQRMKKQHLYLTPNPDQEEQTQPEPKQPTVATQPPQPEPPEPPKDTRTEEEKWADSLIDKSPFISLHHPIL